MTGFNPLDYSGCLYRLPPPGLAYGTEHAAFLYAIVEAVRPVAIVETGSAVAAPAWAFRQAVEDLRLESRLFLPDRGGASVPRPDQFADGTVDLLSIDAAAGTLGRIADWLPKLTRPALVLVGRLHAPGAAADTRSVWPQLGREFRAFEFPHGEGLGVLAVGGSPAGLKSLLWAGDEERAHVRQYYRALGQRAEADHRLEAHLAEADRQARDAGAVTESLRYDLARQERWRKAHLDHIAAQGGAIEDLRLAIRQLRAEVARWRAADEERMRSLAWRLLTAVSAFKNRFASVGAFRKLLRFPVARRSRNENA